MVILHKAPNFEEFLLSKGSFSVQGPKVRESNKKIWCVYTLCIDDRLIGQYCEIYEENDNLIKQCYSGVIPGYKSKDEFKELEIILLEYSLKAECSSELLFYERTDTHDIIPFP